MVIKTVILDKESYYVGEVNAENSPHGKGIILHNISGDISITNSEHGSIFRTHILEGSKIAGLNPEDDEHILAGDYKIGLAVLENKKNGYKFVGQVINGMPNGQGFMIWKHKTYQGEFKDGKACGEGILEYTDGQKGLQFITGMWQDGDIKDIDVSMYDHSSNDDCPNVLLENVEFMRYISPPDSISPPNQDICLSSVESVSPDSKTPDLP